MILKNKHIIILFLIFVLHMSLGFYVYYMNLMYKNTDSWYYYTILSDFVLESSDITGSSFFVFINKIFSRLSFLFISIFYTLISFIPFYHFYIASSNIFNLSKAFFDKFTLILLLFFPSVHFWLASFGKDAFCFVGLCFMLYVVNRKIKNTIFIKVLFIITFLLLFFVRPYIGIIFAIIYLFLERRSIGIRFYFIVPILLIGGYVFLVKFIKFESLDFEYISKKFYILDSYAKTGGSIIDLEKTNVFTRFFYMMFRPFLFEAKNFHQFIVSIENFILLIWFVWLFIRVKRDKIVLNKKILWYASFSILLWLFYSLYIYNYGLASRMKATILPILFYSVILWRENILKLKKSIE